MRVSTGMMYQSGTRAMQDRQAELLRTQQQLSTNRRILSPSDDPIAASQALGLEQAKGVTAQYGENVASARSALSVAENTLGDVTSVLQASRVLLVQAGDPTLSDADRRSIAAELRLRKDELLAAANQRDGQGRYLFAGFREDSVPFVDTGSGITYTGDTGTRKLDVGPSRSMDTAVSGAAIFLGLPSGNGTFATGAAAANTGNGSISVGSVANPAALTGRSYAIDFSVVNGATTYSITDTTLGSVISSGTPYTAGASIVVAGQEVAVRGAPASGDRFTIAPSQGQDLFKPLSDAIAALETPLTTAAARGQAATARERALGEIDYGLDRVLATRSQFGAGLRELDSLDDVNASTTLQYEADISRLTSLDYAKAISEFSAEQQALEAAQKTFQSVSGLSLFKLL